jgi:hypothetical protein
MQVAQEKINIEYGDDHDCYANQNHDFRIKASAKAFKILSDGLYSNKIRAVIRELGTNAADAHVEACKSAVPFKVKLPNSMDPTFALRDFGTGLSPSDIENLYTTYFESTRSNSNDFTGALGLGSKSPFSYTDSFTVVDYWHGVKHVYAAMIGEAGFPTIKLITSEETLEENGLEISFTVRPTDFNKFYEEAIDVYSYFATRPMVVGRQVNWPDRKPAFSENSEGWKLYDNTANVHGHRAVMGNVAYPLDLVQAGCGSNVFSNYAAEFSFTIGEVDMTASRESLEYTPKTIKAVKSKVDCILRTFKTRLDKELAAKPTVWEATAFYTANKLFLGYSASWNGVKLQDYVSFPQTACVKFTNRWNKVKMRPNESINHVSPNDNDLFVENDLPRGGRARVREYLKQNEKIVKAYLIDSGAEWAKLAGVNPPADVVLKASTLPKPPSVRSKRSGPAPKAYIFQSKASEDAKMDAWSAETEVDLKNGGVYIKLDRWDMQEGYSVSFLKNFLENLRTLGEPVPNVVGFRKSEWAKADKSSRWISPNEVLKRLADKFEQLGNSDSLKLCWSAANYYSYNTYGFLKDIIPNSSLQNFLSKVDYCKSSLAKLNAMAWVLRRAGRTAGEDKLADKEMEQVRNRYPMIFLLSKYAGGYSLKADSQTLVSYVNLVERCAVNHDLFQG